MLRKIRKDELYVGMTVHSTNQSLACGKVRDLKESIDTPGQLWAHLTEGGWAIATDGDGMWTDDCSIGYPLMAEESEFRDSLCKALDTALDDIPTEYIGKRRIRKDELQVGMRVCGTYSDGLSGKFTGTVAGIYPERRSAEVKKDGRDSVVLWELRLNGDGYWLAASECAKKDEYLYRQEKEKPSYYNGVADPLSYESVEKSLLEKYEDDWEKAREAYAARMFKDGGWTAECDAKAGEFVTVKTGLLSAIGLGKETQVNSVIAEVFEKTKDAVLVNKFYGDEIRHTLASKLVLIDHKEDYLAESKKRQAEEDKAGE